MLCNMAWLNHPIDRHSYLPDRTAGFKFSQMICMNMWGPESPNVSLTIAFSPVLAELLARKSFLCMSSSLPLESAQDHSVQLTKVCVNYRLQQLYECSPSRQSNRISYGLVLDPPQDHKKKARIIQSSGSRFYQGSELQYPPR